MILRNYQIEEKLNVYAELRNGSKATLLVSPTGSGKTVLICDILREHIGTARVIAHRQELVSQMSLTLAKGGIYHRITAPDSVRSICVALHRQYAGASYHDPWAQVEVAGVDTLIRRRVDPVDLWVIDEAHHVLRDNKWGRAVEQCGPQARGLGVTATPCRADRRGLGRMAAGVFDSMVLGPTVRDLISQGYLSDYRLFGPPSDFKMPRRRVGDYSRKALRQGAVASAIVGDVVAHYARIAMGRRGITFAPDIDTAREITANYNAWTIPAALITARTPDRERYDAIEAFRAGRLLQLVNVDIFGEGFDCPDVEVVTMARPTESYAVYSQQFGRALRPAARRAIIIDHVGNATLRHGLPDHGLAWSLEGKGAAPDPGDGPALRACVQCSGVYERYLPVCPYCGHLHQPAQRGSVRQVDGDLIELAPEAMARLHAARDAIDVPVDEYRHRLAVKRAPRVGIIAHTRRHERNQAAQAELREAIAWWGAWWRHAGVSDRESYMRFYHEFGIDVLGAQGLKAAEAAELCGRVRAWCGIN